MTFLFMTEQELELNNYYYYAWFEMEYVGKNQYNYMFRVRFIDDKLIQEMWSLSWLYKSKKEMMLAMYGNEIEKEIQKLEELRKDRKEYKEVIIEQLRKTAKNLGDNALINAISWTCSPAVALQISEVTKRWIEEFIEKTIKQQ